MSRYFQGLPPAYSVECRTGVVRGGDVDALDLAGELGFQCFQGQQVVAENQAVVELVVLAHPLRSVIRLLRILQQNPRLQFRPVLFPDPGQFQFRFPAYALTRPFFQRHFLEKSGAVKRADSQCR